MQRLLEGGDYSSNYGIRTNTKWQQHYKLGEECEGRGDMRKLELENLWNSNAYLITHLDGGGEHR